MSSAQCIHSTLKCIHSTLKSTTTNLPHPPSPPGLPQTYCALANETSLSKSSPCTPPSVRGPGASRAQPHAGAAAHGRCRTRAESAGGGRPRPTVRSDRWSHFPGSSLPWSWSGRGIWDGAPLPQGTGARLIGALAATWGVRRARCGAGAPVVHLLLVRRAEVVGALFALVPVGDGEH